MIRFLAPEHVFNVEFRCLSIHAGVSSYNIIAFVQEVDHLAKEHGRVWGFLDEINTCQHLGLISDIMRHRVLIGTRLHPGWALLAACNPYELRTRCGPEARLALPSLIIKTTLRCSRTVCTRFQRIC